MKKLILIFSFLTCISVITFSCRKDKKTEEVSKITWTKYTTADGLVNNDAQAIAIDSVGHIWVGTDVGASEFDGVNWKSYAGIGQRVLAIVIDKQGNKWFGTDSGGVMKLEGNTMSFFKHDANSTNSIVSNHVSSIAIDKQGNKWFGTASGVAIFDDVNWVTYNVQDGLASNNVYSISIDKQGNKWFGTGGGVSKFDGTKWTNYSYKSDKTKGIVGNFVMGISIDNQDRKWFATWNGISEFNGTQWVAHDTETEWLVAGSPVLSTASDSKGNKWFGSNGWGISAYNGLTWTTYTTANGSKIDPVSAIAIDAKGNKWFATRSGLLKLNDGN
ncbi:MAG: two component regulator propeller domain-containing protein [Bacteroidetes bacterium]|nr:two component regulator propeller domain-containing protein [Bacteroidota bacterium]